MCKLNASENNGHHSVPKSRWLICKRFLARAHASNHTNCGVRRHTDYNIALARSVYSNLPLRRAELERSHQPPLKSGSGQGSKGERSFHSKNINQWITHTEGYGSADDVGEDRGQ